MRWLLVGVILAAAGCASPPSTSLAWPESPDELTVYSIDGRHREVRLLDPSSKTEAAETFHGYPVLGKVEITDPEQRRELIAALKEGYLRRPQMGAKCFFPRHGIRAVARGKAV